MDLPDLGTDLLWGGAVFVATTDLESSDANRTQNDIDSVGVSVYASKPFVRDTVLNGSLSYVRGDNDVVRSDVGTLAGNNATARFKSEHLALNANISRHKKFKNGVYLQPRAFVNYDYVSADEFTESVAEGLGLRVRYASLNTLSAGGGTIIGKVIETPKGVIVNPSAHISYEHAFIQDLSLIHI